MVSSLARRQELTIGRIRPHWLLMIRKDARCHHGTETSKGGHLSMMRHGRRNRLLLVCRVGARRAGRRTGLQRLGSVAHTNGRHKGLNSCIFPLS